eukprot:TRINITY_DN5140_c3_g1_i1.p1 TRINITY_DN5140_c3_g1~~TRINITY_DN5140_c3_g1_i1.p1  ORF type:complete len:576 (+),score=115.46 TRINITY_DN5140_c3_g1_i1:73-1728(+)
MAAEGKKKRKVGTKASKKVAKEKNSSLAALSAEDKALLAAADAVEIESIGASSKKLSRKRQRAPRTPVGTDASMEEDDGVEETRGTATSSSSRDVVRSGKASRPPQELFKANMVFSQLGLSRWLVEACGKLGMHHPTDIQAMCIPPVLAGKTVAGNAKTGSGKTACYCLPILHHLSKDPYGVYALILIPVRELAFQITESFKALGQGINVQVGEIVGGRDFSIQSQMIADRKHVLVATPGRLADLLRGDYALAQAFRKLKVFVMDEADQLLTSTFEEPLLEIMNVLPKERQTLFFSATITRCIEKLKQGKDLLLLDANPDGESLDNLTQSYVFVPQSVQVCYLHYLLWHHFSEESCIVFAPTIDLCQLFTTMLEILEFEVTGLHSLQSQRQRIASLGKFRAGRSTILVATDVASRGLDIPTVGVVINVGLPLSVDSYVHRSGRTARAGRPGRVVSLMSEHDIPRVKAIEERIGKQLELFPTKEEDAIKLLSKTTKARQRAELLLSEVGFEDRMSEHRDAKKGAKSFASSNKTASDGSKAGAKKKGKKRSPN